MEILFVLSIAFNVLFGVAYIIQKDTLSEQDKFIDTLIAEGKSWH